MATLLLIRDDTKESHVFRGTFTGPSDPSSEWSFLTRDPALGEKLSFRVIDFATLKDVQSVYPRVKRVPFLTISGLPTKTVLDYPQNGELKSDAIRAWILQTVGPYFNEEELPFVDEVPLSVDVSDKNPAPEKKDAPLSTKTDPPSEKKSVPPPEKKTTPPEKKTQPALTVGEDGTIAESESLTGVAIGGSMILAGFVAMGVVLANLLNDQDDPDEESPDPAPGSRLLLIKEDGTPLSFDDVGWDESPPRK